MVDVGGVDCPCGGTHVKNTADIKGITVTKIKKVCAHNTTTKLPWYICTLFLYYNRVRKTSVCHTL